MPSRGQEQGEDERSLTIAQERVLTRELLKRDNIHATQVKKRLDFLHNFGFPVRFLSRVPEER